MELKVVFRNPKHQKLIGIYTSPEGEGPFPTLVMCHGFMAHKNGLFFPAITNQLVKEGWATLRFDCRACGESEGELHPSYQSMVQDLISAINFVKSRNPLNIAILGHSMGGTAALVAAAHDPDVEAVISLAGVAYPKKSLEKKKPNAKAFDDHYELERNGRTAKFPLSIFDDVVDPIAAVQALNIPKLFIHGTEDENISVEEAQELFLAAKLPKHFKRITGADHFFKGEYEEELLNSIVEFIKEVK